MGFRLPLGARKLYNTIDKRTDGGEKFKMLFDIYYLCLILGLDMGKRGSDERLEPDEFLKDDYPGSYVDTGLLITALLIEAELRLGEILPEDKNRTEKLMIRLLNPNSSTKLSSEGIELLNLYAVAGMDILIDKIGVTSELETFLSLYYEIMNSE